ncbi:aldehyde dehydrogenase family protein [Thermomonospora cellulosilytica]|uniref:Acyl-CoA reductase-like NAD-dependent aldehyde dehydrogenase n=1 Tax=Thermomonospora cellulosilytica TaxID=1411118 RepID=A0A7W3MVF3_9ACTN|nr:aldehyde dehydrogenase family protein [Thermomonospora cellulosilytica]MBA9002584.1 acyl-CoA reductase-like NAD-dependent aldehyde dehydrogenase [Thermomonospora cellulosilytica]
MDTDEPRFDVPGMLINGEWIPTGENGRSEVRAPYDGSLVAQVPAAGPRDVDHAVRAAADALRRDDFPRADRVRVLEQTAAALNDRRDHFARAIALEAAKPLKTARVEAARAVETFAFAAAEARRFTGEVVAMDATPPGAGKTGFTLRVPVGVVAAISPFNFPLNLVAHKVAPAIAAGCPVVLKPASQTPVSAILLAELLDGLGVPSGWINVVTGGGGTVGDALATHDDVAYVTFTGSAEVGWGMAAKAARKKVRLELGSNSPLIVDSPSDWRTAASKAAVAGFAHAGQSCISTQRIYLHHDIADDFLEEMLPRVEDLRLGDPLDEHTDVSCLITRDDTARVKEWVQEAVTAGAKLLTGGEAAQNGVFRPTVLEGPPPNTRVQCEEVFGPVVTVTRYDEFDEALHLADDSRYGLQAGVFTSDLGKALKAARSLHFGGVLINEVPTVRADQQPYGGVRDSGNTREGPAYAIQEMTEPRLITLQP